MAKKKSVLGRIVLLTFYSKWAKSKIVKLRILRVQLELVSNETQQLEVSIGILLKLFSFFRLASIKAVFFFPIGICYSCFLFFFSDWHLLKLFSVLRFVEQARN